MLGERITAWTRRPRPPSCAPRAASLPTAAERGASAGRAVLQAWLGPELAASEGTPPPVRHHPRAARPPSPSWIARPITTSSASATLAPTRLVAPRVAPRTYGDRDAVHRQSQRAVHWPTLYRRSGGHRPAGQGQLLRSPSCASRAASPVASRPASSLRRSSVNSMPSARQTTSTRVAVPVPGRAPCHVARRALCRAARRRRPSRDGPGSPCPSGCARPDQPP